jgi:hypothetical protein
VVSPQAVEASDCVDRDERLRVAHKRAFDKIRGARSTSNYHATVSAAVEELVDACEAYTLK